MKTPTASLCVVALAGVVVLAFRTRERVVAQPIAFDHARHKDESLACADCHARAETTPYASFPAIKQCMLCHKEPQGTHPDEPRIREYAEKGEEIPWVQVNRLPGHVYFSHAMHVKVGAMDCAECHGDMGSRKEPVGASQIEHLTMSRCMQCHDERHASNDCLACHK
jgi:hypothetical protein